VRGKECKVKISVIGTGYLGAVHAACLAELGHDVVGVDVDAERVASLQRGDAPFFEPGLDDLLRKHVGGRLRFAVDVAEAADAEVHFLCVGTPQSAHGDAADLTQVREALLRVAGKIRRPALVVGKSTVPVGTAGLLEGILRDVAGPQAELAWNPEFLREGHAVVDTLRPDRLVLGVTSATAEATLRLVYAEPIAGGTPVLVTDYASAELVKSSANAFLATKISFINAVADLCDASGADVTVVAEALGLDERIGRRFLDAGLGYGGGCLPKDVRAFRARADELGVDGVQLFLDSVETINAGRRERVVRLTRQLLGVPPLARLSGHRVAVLGAAFKPQSDDVRDSPALDVARRLHAAGARVTVHDPAATTVARRTHPQLRYAETALDACVAAEVVLHLTEWAEYRALDPAAVAAVVAAPRLVDARNRLDPQAWRAAGWTYVGLGREALGQDTITEEVVA